MAWRRHLAPIFLCWSLGLLMAYHPMLLSGLQRIPTNPGDMRFNHYILEHSYRWLLGWAEHRQFWSPPMFFPAQNTAAYSDILLSVAPLYWLWRLPGIPPDTALQLWLLTIASLNYLAAYVLLRNGFDCAPLAAAFGAFLFAFASVRVNQIMHPQLLPQFFSLIAVFAAVRIFGTMQQGSTARHAAGGWIAVFFASLTAQLYAGFYLGWFLVFGLGIVAMWAMVLPGCRRALLSVLKRYPVEIFLAAGVSALALAPMAGRYMQVARELGGRDFAEVRTMLPTWPSWLYLGPDSWFYGWLTGLQTFRQLSMEHEQRIGLGLFTSVIVALGFYQWRRLPAIQLLLLGSLTLGLLAMLFPNGLTGWKLVFQYVPGATAIRAVSRIGLVLLIPASLGLALFMHYGQGRMARWWLIVIGVVCILEQGQAVPSYDKHAVRADVAALAKTIDPGCRAFLFTPALNQRAVPFWKIHTDAMWAQIETYIPTINGYSGAHPPQWFFTQPYIETEADEQRLAAALGLWIEARGLDPQGICWIKTPVD
jgi:hypothetical protein